MNSVDRHPVCATCGDRVGVYEPIWVGRPDGTFVSSGLLAMERQPIRGPVFHAGCLPGAGAAAAAQ
ncbi:MAG TPA: hypothetical protein VG365_09660 [Solirubrobacteraceae bacterium]|nr:hypothetical protein [Solirubrobacteraceae bacterium]